MAYDPKNPYEATVAEMLDTCLKFNAGSMKLSGDDDKGKTVFLVLVAVKEEAARLLPEIERLTDTDCPDLCEKCAARGKPVHCEEHEGEHPYNPATCVGAVLNGHEPPGQKSPAKRRRSAPASGKAP